MIERGTGNLLQADVGALVNTVNTVGVMGKGIALQFRQAFPANFDAYRRACERGEVVPGRLFAFETGRLDNPKFILNFPTKRHWKTKSRVEDIEAGLADLVRVLRDRTVASVAVPPLGCGNGGLEWRTVKPLIERYLGAVEGTRVILFEPGTGPSSEAMPIATRRPAMNPNRAALLASMRRYREAADDRQSRIEVQKSAYFLQVAGQPLGLTWIAHLFGPYAEQLNFVLRDMEGHFIRGYGDRSRGSSIRVLPEGAELADAELARDVASSTRVERVRRLIDRFEWPYGMELLASMHWVAANSPKAAASSDEAVAAVHAWNDRKAAWPERDIRIAWQRLQEQGWLERRLA
ncbi:MAG: Appr-1-p processing protein [Alphaproteobacteria bacterium]|nr:Appr-1-p processing protein [Alphaproteobacteria bacterium]